MIGYLQPQLAIPRLPVKVLDAAEPDVPVMQSVLPRTARTCRCPITEKPR